MASISTDENGNRAIQFVAVDGKRRTIRLGKASLRLTKEVKVKVESLIAAEALGCSLDLDTAAWVSKIGDDLATKMTAVGLIPRRATVRPLGEFLDSYISQRTDHKPNTTKTIDQARRLLVDFFGPDRSLDKMTVADADNWRNDLRAKGYKPATVATHIKRAKQMFQHAVDAEILERNPFAKLKAPQQIDKSREAFIDQGTIRKVIEAAPNTEWRLIIALARYGGLRTPSETLSLKWSDVDWEHERFTVHSPKLEHLPGRGVRVVPIFPELRPYLEEAFELASEGTLYVIKGYRDGNQNLRTQFERIIHKAGTEPWERLFHNLRSSRQTELTETFPAHVVARWLGNTVQIATQHYLQVTEDHFRRAAKSGAGALQNAVQQPAAPFGIESQTESKEPEIPAFCESERFEAVSCGMGQYPRQESNL